MQKLIFLCALICIASVKVSADSWYCKGEVSEQIFETENVKCTLRSFCPQGNGSPLDSNIDCIWAGRRFFRNLGASTVAISPRKDFLLGLSNSGHHEFAIWLLDNQGHRVFAESHDRFAVNYCKASISILRIWYDLKAVPKFVYVKDKLSDITVQSCDGKIISIMTERFRDKLGNNALSDLEFEITQKIEELIEAHGDKAKNYAFLSTKLKKLPLGVCKSNTLHEYRNGKGGWAFKREYPWVEINTETACKR